MPTDHFHLQARIAHQLIADVDELAAGIKAPEFNVATIGAVG